MTLSEKINTKEIRVKCPAANERFCVIAAEARRQFCAYLEVYRPPEPLWTPRLREAAITLPATVGKRSGNFEKKRSDKFLKKV